MKGLQQDFVLLSQLLFFLQLQKALTEGKTLDGHLLDSIKSSKNFIWEKKRKKLMKIHWNCCCSSCWKWSCLPKTEHSQNKRKHSIKGNFVICFWCWLSWVIAYQEKGNPHPGLMWQLPLLVEGKIWFRKDGTLLNGASDTYGKQWRRVDEKRSLGSRRLEASVDEIERNWKINAVLENIS